MVTKKKPPDELICIDLLFIDKIYYSKKQKRTRNRKRKRGTEIPQIESNKFVMFAIRFVS